jgi:RNA polymerase sigma-70 factor (ECF subfamily)
MKAVETLNPPSLMRLVSGRPRSETQDACRTMLFDKLLVHRESVFRICLGFSRNYAEAEDLAQETYLKAYQGLGKLKNPAISKEWLFRIAKNSCLDHQKKMRIRGRLLLRLAEESSPAGSVDTAADIGDALVRLKAAVRILPGKLKTVFVLREYAHLTYEEISATLSLRMGTVMSRLNRARKRIGAALQETCDGKS